MINAGFFNFIPDIRVIAIIHPASNPSKNLIKAARENNVLIDITQGRKTRSVVIMDSGHLILSAVEPNTLQERIIAGRC